MRFLRGIAGSLITFVGQILTVTLASGGAIVVNGKRFVFLTTAITANVTTTTEAAGTIGFTTNATGRSGIFASDGTHWQNMP